MGAAADIENFYVCNLKLFKVSIGRAFRLLLTYLQLEQILSLLVHPPPWGAAVFKIFY